MPANIEIEFDRSMKKWSKALSIYLKTTRKDVAKVINQKLFFVVKRALKLTPRASKALIEHGLGVVAYRVSISKKDGKFKARRKIIEGTKAVNIIQGSRVNAGEKPLTKKEAERAARKMINARLRAIGSLAAGWIKILRTFSRAAKTGHPFVKAPRIKHKGAARAANPRKKVIEAMAEYAVHVRRGGKLVVDPRVIAAAARAFRLEAKDTGMNIAKRYSKNWKKRLV